jgi:hypothetical protein
MVGPSIDILYKFGLTYHDGSPMSPAYIGDSVVWAASSQGDDDPYYAIFTPGTNDLKILECNNNIWKEIKIKEFNNLYGFLWKMFILNDIIPRIR